MPFTWRINITRNPKAGGPAIFEFEQAPQIRLGDQVLWSNNDTVPHWPGVAGNPAIFMPNQIASNSTSPAFAPAPAGPSAGTVVASLSYFCSLHEGETGVIPLPPPAPLPAPPIPVSPTSASATSISPTRKSKRTNKKK